MAHGRKGLCFYLLISSKQISSVAGMNIFGRTQQTCRKEIRKYKNEMLDFEKQEELASLNNTFPHLVQCKLLIINFTLLCDYDQVE